MNSFTAYIKKEVLEGIRNFKFLIIALGIILFALLDPLMLKLLPHILENQAPGIDLSQLVNYTQEGAIQNYMKNLFQISNLVIVLSLMGLLADEIKNKTLIIPYSNKGNLKGIILAKYIVYSIVLVSITIIGFLINYYYSKILFPEEVINITKLLKSSLIFGIYFLFNLSLILFMSSLFKKGIIAGILSLSIIYLSPAIDMFEKVSKYFPHYLLKQANLLSTNYSDFIIKSILITFLYIIILIGLTIYRMNKIELN